MISNEEFKLIFTSFHEFHNTNSLFSAARELIAIQKENSTFNPTQLLEIKDLYSKRKEQLEKFEKEISKLEYIMNIEVLKPFIVAIHNEIASLDMMTNDATKYIETMDPKYIDSVMYGFDLEKEQNHTLMRNIMACEQALGIYFLNQIQTSQMTLEDLKEINLSIEPNSILYKRLSEVISIIEKEKLSKSLIPIEQNQADIQQKSDTLEQNSFSVVEESKQPENITQNSPKPKEATLQEKLDRLNYTLGNNLHAEVQTITAEDSLANIIEQIKILEAKDRLSFKETIQLHTLRDQELGIQKYIENIETQNLALGDKSREKKLAKNSSKIELAQSNLIASRSNFQNYDSKVMRFLSMRYQEQLQANIMNLRQKNGILASVQKESAVAKFAKNSRKISRGAKFTGFINGTKQITTEKIEQLKQLKAEVIGEISKIRQDIGRYTSEHSDISRLRYKNGVIADNIIYLDEHTQSHRMSA